MPRRRLRVQLRHWAALVIAGIRVRVRAWRLVRRRRWRESLAPGLERVSDRWLAEHHHGRNEDVDQWLINH